jgi:macrolide phosphotransferase
VTDDWSQRVEEARTLAARHGLHLTGIIDWTEAEISDPSIDFAGHLAAFPPESLEHLVSAYERAGERVWPTLLEQIEERNANASAVRYGIFALDTKSDRHLAAAREQLGAG